MAWTNILDIPGLTYAVHYREYTSDPDFSYTPTHPVLVSGGSFALNAGADPTVDWQVLAIEITDFGGIELPTLGRITATALASPGWEQDTYGLGLEIRDSLGGSAGSGSGHSGNPYSGTSADLAVSASNKYFVLNPGYPFAFASGSLVIEIDAETVDPPVSDFWTEFAGTEEILP